MSANHCTHPGCNRHLETQRYCLTHARRARAGSDMNAPIRRSHPPITATEVARIRELIPGRTCREVAEIVGLFHGTVQKIIVRNGIPPGVPRGQNRGSKPKAARPVPQWMLRSAEYEAARAVSRGEASP